MNNPKLVIALFFCMVLACTAEGVAQDSSQKKFDVQWIDSTHTDIHEITFLGGYSPSSTNGFWGKTPGATLELFAFGYNRKLLNIRSNQLLKYATEIAISTNYYNPGVNQEVNPGHFSGFGLLPLGFQYNGRTDTRIQPFLKSLTGFLYLDNPFPDDRGKKLNFVLEVGTGVEFKISNFSSISVGYKYHHMSNGQTGQINPGVDSNIFYGSVTFF